MTPNKPLQRAGTHKVRGRGRSLNGKLGGNDASYHIAGATQRRGLAAKRMVVLRCGRKHSRAVVRLTYHPHDWPGQSSASPSRNAVRTVLGHRRVAVCVQLQVARARDVHSRLCTSDRGRFRYYRHPRSLRDRKCLRLTTSSRARET